MLILFLFFNMLLWRRQRAGEQGLVLVGEGRRVDPERRELVHLHRRQRFRARGSGVLHCLRLLQPAGPRPVINVLEVSYTPFAV